MLRHGPPRSPDELEELEKRTLEVIRNPGFNTSHFTQDAGISWLVRALGERLTPALCGEFAERTRTFEIQELRLLDFVQRHLVAGEGFGAVGPDPREEPTSS